jgi:hypothetical protein
MPDRADREEPREAAVLDLPRPRRTGQDAELAAMVDYWAQMCPPGGVPRRSAIDPRRIEALLGRAFIAEKVAPGLARLRIAGAQLSELMGMEVRGMPVSAFLQPAGRDRLADALVHVFEGPASARLDLVAPGGRGQPALTGTLLMLPLRSDLGDISRALGCLVSRGDIGRPPRRFDIAQLSLTRIETAGADKATGTARAPCDAAPAPRPPSRSERPYLRLVKSDA